MIALLAITVLTHRQTADSIWIEGESPSSINVKANISGWGHKEFLSGEKWLQVSMEPDQVAKELPPDGALISYSFHCQAPGSHEIWNRIGYESVRSPFEWRVDSEPWKRVAPEDLTTDMQEFATWNEVAWLKMGDEKLPVGDHTLQIRLAKSGDAQGKTARILYASDALLINSAHFHPNGKFAPGAQYLSDIDRQAAAKTYTMPAMASPDQQEVELGGLWQIARDDEKLPGVVERPFNAPPADLIWYGISVPSDKNVARPELTMAHRVWYRMRFNVPEAEIGHQFRLTFPQNNLNTTVFVNGKRCGFNKNPFVKWSCDVTKALHVGDNEFYVGIRDAWYGYSSNPNDPMKLRRSFVIPLERTGDGFQDLAYPVWHSFMSGILDTPRMTISNLVAVTDVFVKPSVSTKSLGSEVTLKNCTAKPVKGQIHLIAFAEGKGAAKRFEPVPFDLKPDEEKTLQISSPWANPSLWWPDQPRLYQLQASLEVGGRTVDNSETRFGFREWSVRGKDILLNGVVWHGWAELNEGKSKEEWLHNYRATGQRFMRMFGPSQNGGVTWQGMSYEKSLDWLDQNGVIVRRCGPLDGEAIGYFAVENDPALQQLYHMRVKKQLLHNWRDQMVAQVKGERNHPSIGIWSIENEWLYINCINLYGDLMDEFEREEKATLDAVKAVDPTRPAMADGGGAGKANLFPIQGDHYVYTNDPSQYPNLAYEPFPDGAGRGRWKWDQKRPRYIGEEFFATGINPSDYAWIEGEEAFAGKKESEKGMAMVERMLTEGYRWGGHYAAWQLWLGNEGAEYGKFIPNADRAVFCREQNWSFGSGEPVKRTLGIFNDSHYSDPLDLTYRVRVQGKTLFESTTSYVVTPGGNKKFAVTLQMPKVASRTSGEFLLSLRVKGAVVFNDRKPFWVLPSVEVSARADRFQSTPWLGVYDPANRLVPLLREEGFSPSPIAKLDSVPPSTKVLVVAPNSIQDLEATDPRLSALAAEGRRVIVLNQNHPLHFQALPFGAESFQDAGEFAYPEVADHAAFAGLSASDFRGWDGAVYRDAYAKPESGARSLLQVGSRLNHSALIESPVGEGLLILCQVMMPEPGARNPVAETLLRNLVEYAHAYRLRYRKTAAAISDDHDLAAALKRTGVRYQPADTPLQAIDDATGGIAIVSASPQNLHTLAQNLVKVQGFYDNGGTLLFQGLTPDGLADYNKIVGVDHMIRPFRRERVGIRIPRDPLASGLSNSNVVMYSGEKMFDFNDDRFVASDIFSYVVDYDDAAPFATLPDATLYNTVNGFVSADGWKYIYSFGLDQSKPEYEMRFPKPQTLQELTWIGNAFYHKVTKLSLTFDGKETRTFDVLPNNEPQILKISPVATGSTVRLKILDWTHDATSANVVGIDNISLKAERSQDFYQKVHPLLNVGGLVRYSEGKGSAVLSNLLFKAREEVPENADKKVAILSSILHNLGAEFSGTRTVIAGAANVQYSTIDISKRANQYRDGRGWFGDKQTTFADLPSGRHVLGGVPFDIFDFPTSPVPTAIMLGGPGLDRSLPDAVEGIPVNAQAAALFFLQTARIDQHRSPEEVAQGKNFELAEYVIHYADGQTATVPILAEVTVDDYRQPHPKPLPGAQLAWTHAYPGSELQAAAYVQQWNNPRPEVAIQSIDLRYGKDRRGIPVLLAVTAAK